MSRHLTCPQHAALLRAKTRDLGVWLRSVSGLQEVAGKARESAVHDTLNREISVQKALPDRGAVGRGPAALRALLPGRASGEDALRPNCVLGTDRRNVPGQTEDRGVSTLQSHGPDVGAPQAPSSLT